MGAFEMPPRCSGGVSELPQSGGPPANVGHSQNTTSLGDGTSSFFKLLIKIGIPNIKGGVSEKVNNERYATSIGLINYGSKHWNPQQINHILFLFLFKKCTSLDEIFLIPKDTTLTFGLSKHLLIAEA